MCLGTKTQEMEILAYALIFIFILGKYPQTPLNIQAKLEWLRISTETLLLQINTIKGL